MPVLSLVFPCSAPSRQGTPLSRALRALLRRGARLPVALGLWALACASAAAQGHDHSFGTHGMVLFGDRGGLYASHLPLFHAPHDHQVVLRIRLADTQLDRALRQQLHGKTALWTIEPERFALSRLAPSSAAPLRAFGADIFSGHFERGGRRAHAGVRVVVDGVLVYRRLDASARRRAQARYLPVGRFLVKEIDSRPDFDHIVALKEPARSAITIGKIGLDNPEAALARSAAVRGTVYFETGDLR